MQNWISTEHGWVAFASDLARNSNDPMGNPIDVRDGTWKAEHDREGELLSWRKHLPNGKMLTVYND